MMNPVHRHGGNRIVEEYIGTAYENVKTVAENLADIGLVADAVLNASKFKGTFTTEALMNAQAGSEGSYAYLDAGVGDLAHTYLWDHNDNVWVKTTDEDIIAAWYAIHGYGDPEVTMLNLLNGVRNAVGYSTVAQVEALPAPDADNQEQHVQVLTGLGRGKYIWDPTSLVTPEPVGSHPNGVIKPTSVTGAGRWIFDYDSHIILIAEQDGTTDGEKYNNALKVARAGQIVIGSPDLVIELSSQPTAIPSYVTVYGANAKLIATGSLATLILAETDGTSIEHYGFRVDAAGLNSVAVYGASGVRGLKFHSSSVEGATARIFDINSSLAQSSTDVSIHDIYFDKPANGIGFPVAIGVGMGRPRMERVSIKDCVFWGIDPQDEESHIASIRASILAGDRDTVPYVTMYGDYTATNSFGADWITLHGVKDYTIDNVTVKYSGSAGTTQTRGCENGVTKNCLFDTCFEPAANLGFLQHVIHVEDGTGFLASLNLSATGANPITTGQIDNVRMDEVGNGAWLWVDPVQGGEFELGSTVTQSNGFTSTITVAPDTTVYEPGEHIIEPARDIQIIDNEFLDCNIQRDQGAIFANRCRGDSIVSGNEIHNPRGLGQSSSIIYGTNSRIGYGVNKFEGFDANSSKYVATGGLSEWIYQDTAIHEALIGRSLRTAAAANATTNEGMSMTRTSNGRYRYVLDKDYGDTDYMVDVTSQQAGRIVSFSIVSSTEFDVFARIEDGTQTNTTHSVRVYR